MGARIAITPTAPKGNGDQLVKGRAFTTGDNAMRTAGHPVDLDVSLLSARSTVKRMN
jgi:hypothetical protein